MSVAVKKRHRGVAPEYAGLKVMVDFANLVDPALVDRLKQTDKEIRRVREALVDAQMKGTAEGVDDDLLAAATDAALVQDQALVSVWDDARRRFPDPRGWDAVMIPVPGRPLEQGPGFAGAIDLVVAAWAVRCALRLIVEMRDKPASQRGQISFPPSDATAPRVQVLDDGTIVAPVDLFRDALLPALHNRNARNLGICPACNMLFIARRPHQRACGKAHGHTLLMREKRRAAAVGTAARADSGRYRHRRAERHARPQNPKPAEGKR